MKKIVAVATLASLLAGAAFAADISFSYTGKNYFTSSGDDNIAFDKTEHDLSFGLTNDTFGADVEFDIYAAEKSAYSKDKLEAAAKDGDADSVGTDVTYYAYGLNMDHYYGWMNFGENLQFKAGLWTDRDVNRVKTDRGDLDDEDFEFYKPGVVNGYVASDSSNLTNGSISMQAAYTMGALTLKGLFVNGNWDSFSKTEDGDSYTRTNSYGFAGQVGYSQEDSFDLIFAVRSLKVYDYSFGLFFSPKMIENLEATAGLSLGLAGNATHKADGDIGTEFGIDLRARYQITEKLSVTTMHNLSSYLTGVKSTDAKKWEDNVLGLWDQLNFTYAFADNMKAGITVQSYISDFDNDDYVFDEIVVSPSWTIQATEKAAVTVAARGTFKELDVLPTSETFTFTLPVIFSYNY